MTQRIAYGGHPSQFGELTRPAGCSRGTVMLLHGGFWRSRTGLELNRAQAGDLAGAGYTCWNVEYRRLGGGGGWPATFDDAAAALDHLAELDPSAAVVVVGHSAGGLLAAWLGMRRDRRGRAEAVVAQAAVLDPTAAARAGLGDGAVVELLDGGPDDVPDRYRSVDPRATVPLAVPVLCLHGRDDGRVPFAQSESFVTATRTAGGSARLVEVPGDHLVHLDPASPAWMLVRDALPDLLRGRLPRSPMS